MIKHLVIVGTILVAVSPAAALADETAARIALVCEAGTEELCGRVEAELHAAGQRVDKLAEAADLGLALEESEAVVQVERAPAQVSVHVRRDGVVETRDYRLDSGAADAPRIVATQVAEALRATFAQHSTASAPPAATVAAEPVPAAAPAVVADEVARPVAVANESAARGSEVARVAFHDGATVGKGRLVLSSASRYGGGFAGYTGIDGPALGQTVDVAYGLTDWLHIVVGGGAATGSSACVDGPNAGTCYQRLYYGAALRLGAKLYRSQADAFQLGLEVSGGVYYVPYSNMEFAELSGSAALTASGKLFNHHLLPYAKVGWGYQAAPENLHYFHNGYFASLGLELAVSKVHPFLEVGLVGPKVAFHTGRPVTYAVSLGLTGLAL